MAVCQVVDAAQKTKTGKAGRLGRALSPHNLEPKGRRKADEHSMSVRRRCLGWILVVGGLEPSTCCSILRWQAVPAVIRPLVT